MKWYFCVFFEVLILALNLFLSQGFLGHSYLVHVLNSDNRTIEAGIHLEVNFKSTHSEGILFYTGQEGAMFVASFLEEGVLHFKVSCGHQLITFSDPKHRLDSGHQHTLELRVTVAEEEEGHTCRVL